MSLGKGQLALYTTVYPGVERFLREWHASVLAQSDQDFDLWIGLDSISPEQVRGAVGGPLSAEWVPAARGATPADVRQRALAQVVERYEAVVFVDADDILLPTRVEAARAQLADCDVAGCAMRLIGEDGTELGDCFNLPLDVSASDVFPRLNAYGLTNSAYRTGILGCCLPIPSETEVVDWYLATRAWLSEASFDFDRTTHMLYRQRIGALACIPPCNGDQVRAATRVVLNHYERLLAAPDRLGTRPEQDQLSQATQRVARFSEQIEDPRWLDRYVRELNTLGPTHLWWSCVAHPLLEEIWNKG